MNKDSMLECISVKHITDTIVSTLAIDCRLVLVVYPCAIISLFRHAFSLLNSGFHFSVGRCTFAFRSSYLLFVISVLKVHFFLSCSPPISFANVKLLLRSSCGRFRSAHSGAIHKYHCNNENLCNQFRYLWGIFCRCSHRRRTLQSTNRPANQTGKTGTLVKVHAVSVLV